MNAKLGGEQVTWHKKYWDAVDHFYWEPSHLGLRSINRGQWGDDLEWIKLPRSLIKNGGTLYTRAGTAKSNALRARGLEETLNHIFDITFAIAPDDVTARLLHRWFDIEELGPIDSIGREISDRYGWGEANVTQQDGFFVSPTSAIAVELKLGAITSPIQVLKYLALMVLEEERSGPKEHLGLLYITPDATSAAVFKQCGADDLGRMPPRFWESLPKAKINPTLTKLLAEHAPHFEAGLNRLRIAQISWSDLTRECALLRAELVESSRGKQTLSRLLEGFIAAVVAHTGTSTSDIAMTDARGFASVAHQLLEEANETGAEKRVHYLRLHRALVSRLDSLHNPNAGSAAHVISRLGVWAEHLAAELEAGTISSWEAARLLRFLAQAGDETIGGMRSP